MEKSTTEESRKTVKCWKCDEIFNYPEKKDEIFLHFYLSHRLVIADVEDIADLYTYLQTWEVKFRNNDLNHFCTTMLLDQLPDGTPSKNEKYYLLSDILQEDNEIRKTLHSQRLELALKQHQFELTDRRFTRGCLFCRDNITGLRSDYIVHLFRKHFLQLGKPENLIYIEELINHIQKQLDNLVCIFCEKIFKDRPTLKEHMRKKGHKRINPYNKYYDKFFLINYKYQKKPHTKNLFGQNRKDISNQNEKYQILPTNIIEGEESDSDWSEWKGEPQHFVCLFCKLENKTYVGIKSHMFASHGVDFEKDIKFLTFYEKVKVVNYIRRQIQTNHCIFCDEKFQNFDDLEIHLKENMHYGMGNKKQWDKPVYFFPTFENDGILCSLEDINSIESEDSGISIQVENTKVTVNKDAEALSIETLQL